MIFQMSDRFENRVLRRIFGPKRDEVRRQWRKFHNGELCNLCSSPYIIGQIKSRRMRWAGHVAHMGGEKRVEGFGGKARGKESTWKTKAWMGEGDQNGLGGGGWTGFTWLRRGTGCWQS
jgi:hypothetical protein